jgi:hypothetical protein
MAHVSPYDMGAEAESFVDRLPFREHSIWNHHGFLTSEAGL